MEIKMQIARAVKRAREAKDYTQEYVAEELGMTSSAYSKIERGVSTLKTETAIELAKLYGITIDQLVGQESGLDNLLMEGKAKYGRSVPEQVVFVFNGVGKNSPRADRFLKRLTQVMRDLDRSDYEDFLDKKDD